MPTFYAFVMNLKMHKYYVQQIHVTNKLYCYLSNLALQARLLCFLLYFGELLNVNFSLETNPNLTLLII